MKRLILAGMTIFLLLIYLLYISQFEIYVAEEKLELETKGIFYDYKGAFHVHTSKGQGRYSTRDVLIEANRAGLDFVVFSDLNIFDDQTSFEGYYRNTLGIQARQFSYLDSRVVLVESDNKTRFENLNEAQLYLTDKLTDSKIDESIFVSLSHPNKPGYKFDKKLWDGLHSIEVVNFKSIWQNSWTESKASFLYSILSYPFNKNLALLRIFEDPIKNIELWDQNTAPNRRVTGVLANHATAKTKNLIGVNFEFPSYHHSFSIGSNHLLLKSELTGDKTKDRAKVFNALLNGQFYFSLDMLEDPSGFEAYITNRNEVYPLGSKVPFAKNLELKVNLPHKIKIPFEIIVFRNGERVGTYNQNNVSFPIKSTGAYRVSVRVIPTLPLPDGKRWFTWIYANPLYVYSEDSNRL